MGRYLKILLLLFKLKNKKTSNEHKKIKEQEKLAKYRLYIIIKKMK